MSEHKIKIQWKGGEDFTFEKYNRNHTIFYAGGQTLINSSTTETFGDSKQSNPEELLASAVSTCHMLTFLAVASKKKKTVISYEDEATAILEKGESGKLQVTKIYLKPKVVFSEELSLEELNKIHDSAHRNCFIGLSVKSEVIIEPII